MEDVDTARATVSGYFSAFNVMDSDRDIILPGAFKQSISQRGPKSQTNRKVAFLYMHDWKSPVGRLTELEEDGYGLKFVAEMGQTQIAKETLQNYEDGILREHSIGFRYIPDRMKYDENQDAYLISELNLFEGSAVLFGANEFTPVLEIRKDADPHTVCEEMTAEVERMIKAMRTAGELDTYSLEMQLRVLAEKYFSYIDALIGTQPEVSTVAAVDDTKRFILNFLNK